MVFEILIEACASFQRRIVLDSRFRGNDVIEACASFQRCIVLDSRFRGNDVMPALRLRSGQAPAGIQFVGCACAPFFCPQSMVRRAHPTPYKPVGILLTTYQQYP